MHQIYVHIVSKFLQATWMGTPWGWVFFRKRPEEVATAMVPLLLSRIYPGMDEILHPAVQDFCINNSNMMCVLLPQKPKETKGKYLVKKMQWRWIRGYILGLILSDWQFNNKNDSSTKPPARAGQGVRMSVVRMPKKSLHKWITLSEYDLWRM